uniref:Putative transmembrane protein n=1 Tax=Toxoplasma gondii TgCATBr9 TaxID=943120 RepID=A0A2T6IIZ2_TOXGO|nr:putative transmembrane protein [Toxoplasma gondii TgCATBr9]
MYMYVYVCTYICIYMCVYIYIYAVTHFVLGYECFVELEVLSLSLRILRLHPHGLLLSLPRALESAPGVPTALWRILEFSSRTLSRKMDVFPAFSFGRESESKEKMTHLKERGKKGNEQILFQFSLPRVASTLGELPTTTLLLLRIPNQMPTDKETLGEPHRSQ